ncbi:hypothetical protein LXA43DRAFT_972582 [Ganoderma leucocontextum]|nr:hypothetical protein LXA43DRAFT_972582 [Ganoderma leucocontextum]
MATDDVVSKATRLTNKYPNAYSDFYGSGTPCVFKSGPDWRVRKGHQARRIEREARPVYRHAIGRTWLSIGGRTWLSIGRRIYHDLDSIGVKWTSINPLAYADAGEAKPFYPLILSIGVKPHSLLYDAAVAAAAVVKENLAEAGFPAFEVAFGPCYRERNELLTSLACVPTRHARVGVDRRGTGDVGTGQDGGALVVFAKAEVESGCALEVGVLEGCEGETESGGEGLSQVGDVVEEGVEREELGAGSDRRTEHVELVAKATKKIEEVNAIHDEVTKCRTTPDQRVIGFVLHSEKIEVSLYDEKIDWSTFKGNQVYVGGNLSIADFGDTMLPQSVDQANYRYPRDGLLQAYGVVQEDEIRDPQHLDVYDEKCLLVVKNGLTTGTTVGRANGLESFTRIYDNYGIKRTSIEIAVLPYDKMRGKFSDAGDSGSIVLAGDGRIVGILTGGAGPIDETDITYLTPYWWVDQQIQAKYPGCFLYEVVQYVGTSQDSLTSVREISPRHR